MIRIALIAAVAAVPAFAQISQSGGGNSVTIGSGSTVGGSVGTQTPSIGTQTPSIGTQFPTVGTQFPSVGTQFPTVGGGAGLGPSGQTSGFTNLGGISNSGTLGGGIGGTNPFGNSSTSGAPSPGAAGMIFVNPDAIVGQTPRSFGLVTGNTPVRLSQIRTRFLNQGPSVDFAVFSLTSQVNASVRQQLASGLSSEEFAQQTGIFTSNLLPFKSFGSGSELASNLELSQAAQEVYVALTIFTPQPNGGLPFLAALEEITTRLGANRRAVGEIESLIGFLSGELAIADVPGVSRSAAMASIWPAMSAQLLVRTLQLLQDSGTIPAPATGSVAGAGSASAGISSFGGNGDN